MRENKITLAYVRGWDHFDMDRYNNYLKALNHVENTLSRLHWRSLEDIRKERESRLICSSKAKSRCVGGINNQSK
jgi:hypothetical protein